MQPTPQYPQHVTSLRLFWREWNRSCFVVLLVLLQLVLPVETIKFYLDWPIALGLGTLGYLLIPGLIGFFAADQPPDDLEDSNDGFRVGGISALVVAIVYFFFIGFIWALLLLTLEGVVGVTCGSLGHWLGGTIGQRVFHPAKQGGSATASKHP